MTSTTNGAAPRRRRIFPLVWLGSAAAATLLALGVNGSLSAFSAQITNSNNTTSVGSLLMSESGPGSTGAATTCSSSQDTTGANSYSCTTINKYGANGVTTPLAPGLSNTTTVTIANPGTVAAGTFTLKFNGCTQTPVVSTLVGNLCSDLTVTVYQAATATGTPVVPATALSAAGTYTLTAPNATGAKSTGQAYTFVISMPNNGAATDNLLQGVSVTQPIVWTFNQ